MWTKKSCIILNVKKCYYFFNGLSSSQVTFSTASKKHLRNKLESNALAYGSKEKYSKSIKRHAVLWSWKIEHMEHIPTKEEACALAQLTGLHPDQVSNWMDNSQFHELELNHNKTNRPYMLRPSVFRLMGVSNLNEVKELVRPWSEYQEKFEEALAKFDPEALNPRVASVQEATLEYESKILRDEIMKPFAFEKAEDINSELFKEIIMKVQTIQRMNEETEGPSNPVSGKNQRMKQETEGPSNPVSGSTGSENIIRSSAPIYHKYQKSERENYKYSKFLGPDLPTLILDASFTDLMSLSVSKRSVNSINRGYDYNKEQREPFHLHVTGLDPLSHLATNLKDMNELGISFTEEPFEKLYDLNELVYLTSDAKNPIKEYNPKCTYIIGAIDNDPQPENHLLTVSKAKRLGIRSQRLPLKLYFKMVKQGSHFHPDVVMNIMGDMHNGFNIREAMTNNIPAQWIEIIEKRRNDHDFHDQKRDRKVRKNYWKEKS